MKRHTDKAEISARDVNRPFATIDFNFQLPHAVADVPSELIDRPRAAVPA